MVGTKDSFETATTSTADCGVGGGGVNVLVVVVFTICSPCLRVAVVAGGSGCCCCTSSGFSSWGEVGGRSEAEWREQLRGHVSDRAEHTMTAA